MGGTVNNIIPVQEIVYKRRMQSLNNVKELLMQTITIIHSLNVALISREELNEVHRIIEDCHSRIVVSGVLFDYCWSCEKRCILHPAEEKLREKQMVLATKYLSIYHIFHDFIVTTRNPLKPEIESAYQLNNLIDEIRGALFEYADSYTKLEDAFLGEEILVRPVCNISRLEKYKAHCSNHPLNRAVLYLEEGEGVYNE